MIQSQISETSVLNESPPSPFYPKKQLSAALFKWGITRQELCESLESLLESQGVEAEVSVPLATEELYSPTSKSKMVKLNDEHLGLFNRIEVELFYDPIKIDLHQDIRKGLADALRSRARELLSVAQHVLSGPEIPPAIPSAVTAEDLVLLGEPMQAAETAYRREWLGIEWEFVVIDEGEVVCKSESRSLAEAFCNGAGLPHSSIKQISQKDSI